MRADRLLFSLAFAALVALSPSSARAFCRTRTIAAPPSFDPASTKSGCFEQGQPLYHPSQCVPYHLLAAESPRIARAVLSNSLARAFGAWTGPNSACTPGITPIELAPVPDTKVADYKTGERGHNVIGVIEGPWPHQNVGSETLSLATLTFAPDTGEVYDADLEIRSDVAWSFGATPPPDGFDLDAVLTHEVGHFLGLAHTTQTDAVMYPTYTPGSITQRKLAVDDARAICAIYPDRETRVTGTAVIASTPCDLSPGASGGTCGDPAITHGCAVSAATGGTHEGWCLAILGAVAALSRRSRGRTRRST